MNKLFLIFLISFSLIFASCGEDVDCSTQDSDYMKFGLDEESDECVIIKEIEKNKCGNGVIEEGETYCNCEDDVFKEHPELGCFGNTGEYLENTCNSKKECVLTQNDKVVSQVKNLNFIASGLVIEGTFELNSPFILNSEDNNNVKVDLSLFKTSTSTSINIKDIKIKELKIEDLSLTQLARINYDYDLVNIDDKVPTKSVPLKDTNKYESFDSLQLKLVVSFTRETLDSTSGEVIFSENLIETLQGSLGSWTIINPVFYEE